jgi:hypothetical protein
LAELRTNNDNDDFLLSQDGPLGRIELSTQQARDLQIVDQVDADAALREGEEERRKKLQETEADNEPKWINDAGWASTICSTLLSNCCVASSPKRNQQKFHGR